MASLETRFLEFLLGSLNPNAGHELRGTMHGTAKAADTQFIQNQHAISIPEIPEACYFSLAITDLLNCTKTRQPQSEFVDKFPHYTATPTDQFF